MNRHHIYFMSRNDLTKRTLKASSLDEAMERARDMVSKNRVCRTWFGRYPDYPPVIECIQVRDCKTDETRIWRSERLHLELGANDLLEAARDLLARWQTDQLTEAVRALQDAVSFAVTGKRALIPDDLRRTLLNNGRFNANERFHARPETDFLPVVKLYEPCGDITWLLSELDPDEPDIAFGLCDLGTGLPELGNVRISELEAYPGVLGMGIERDLYFYADKTLRAYAEDARNQRRFIMWPRQP